MSDKIRKLVKVLIGITVLISVLIRTIWTPESPLRLLLKTSDSNSLIGPMPKNQTQIAIWLAHRIAIRCLSSVWELSSIGGFWLNLPKNHSSNSMIGHLSRWVFRWQPRHENSSCQSSDPKIKGLSNDKK
ncbi:MAG: hypothetical protein WDM80_16055 [Limisphaerales bacterium]